MEQRRYVSTDREGRSRTAEGEVIFEVPRHKEPAQGAFPISPAAESAGMIELRTTDGLLDDLGVRIFVAEAIGEVVPEEGPVLRARDARLLSETAWDDEAAARFALECTEHALGDDGAIALPHGRTLAGVLSDVRAVLDRAEAPAASLGWLDRFAALRRLRRDGAAVSDLAMLAAKQDEDVGLDLLDDPAWTSLAAIAEAVLACAEALGALSHLKAREKLEASQRSEEVPTQLHVEETPWGWIALGSKRVPAHLSAARCAQHAAERARQAVTDSFGVKPGQDERAFQATLLDSILEAGSPR
jgi:hypothetical protein